MKTILLILVIVILSSNIVFADNKIDLYRNELDKYLKGNQHDFMGMRGESLYFSLREEYSNNNILKKISFDIKTTDLQLKTSAKCFKDNKEIYLVSSLPFFKKFVFMSLKPIF